MALVGGAASLAGGLAGMFGGGGANSVQLPPQFNMPNMGAAANNAFSGIGNLGNYNLFGQNIGQAQNIAGGLVNNPYAGGFQQGANTAGGLGQLQALGQYNTGQNLVSGGNQVLNTAMDPQQALYNQLLQQTQDQSGATNAAAGVGTTPYGAGLTNQALTNFNIDWQNQQLQRQLQGLQGAGSAYTTGQGLSAAAPGQYANSSALPYNAYGQIGGGQLGALNTLGQFGQSASALPQQSIQDYLAYIGAGNQAGGVANQQAQLALNQQQQGFNQNQIYGSQIGAGLGALGGQGWGIGGPAWGNLGGSGFGNIGGTGGNLGGLY